MSAWGGERLVGRTATTKALEVGACLEGLKKKEAGIRGRGRREQGRYLDHAGLFRWCNWVFTLNGMSSYCKFLSRGASF